MLPHQTIITIANEAAQAGGQWLAVVRKFNPDLYAHWRAKK